jgi:hypothetical protein
MRIGGNIVAVILLLLGGLWILQGANLIGGSVMSGHSQWLYIGIVLVVVSLALLWWSNRRRV